MGMRVDGKNEESKLFNRFETLAVEECLLEGLESQQDNASSRLLFIGKRNVFHAKKSRKTKEIDLGVKSNNGSDISNQEDFYHDFPQNFNKKHLQKVNIKTKLMNKHAEVLKKFHSRNKFGVLVDNQEEEVQHIIKRRQLSDIPIKLIKKCNRPMEPRTSRWTD